MTETPEFTEIATGLRFPEGPIAMPDASVLVVEIARGTLTRVAADGAVDVVADCGGGPNGAAVGPDGMIYITNNGGSLSFFDVGGLTIPGPVPPEWDHGSIQRVDPSSGAVETLYDSCDGRRLRGPNDLVMDGHGGFWFTDHGVRLERTSDLTGLYYALADGSSIREVVFPLEAPNGVGLSPDGRHVYVAETFTGRVWQWEITEPGVVAEAPPRYYGLQPLWSAPGTQMLDSLAVDGDGHVCVATIAEGGIVSISPDGSDVEHLPTGDTVTTNICFGGKDLRTAYLTLSSTGRLVSMRWPRPGLRLPHQ